MWQTQIDHRDTNGIAFTFDGTPYMVAGKETYICQQGKDLNQQKKQNYRKKRLELQVS